MGFFERTKTKFKETFGLNKDEENQEEDGIDLFSKSLKKPGQSLEDTLANEDVIRE